MDRMEEAEQVSLDKLLSHTSPIISQICITVGISASKLTFFRQSNGQIIITRGHAEDSAPTTRRGRRI